LTHIRHVLVAGLLITFVFLALNSTCKPFCAVGLSHLHSLTMVAQFITLFAGLVIIVENYIHDALIAAGEADTTAEKVSFITYLVYLFNGAVVVWPALDGFMQADLSETLEEFKNMCASFVDFGKDSKSADPSNLILADKGEEFVISPGAESADHTTTLKCPENEQKTPFQDTGNQEPSYASAGQVQWHTFEHAGGVRAQAQPVAGQP
jgi:hypothetical protein